MGFALEERRAWRGNIIGLASRRLRQDGNVTILGDPFTDPFNDILSRLPRMTNRQISEVTPEAWCKAQRQRQSAA